MNKLSIKDLNDVQELSADEAAKISGGFLSLIVAGATALGLAANKAGVFDSIPVSDMLKR